MALQTLILIVAIYIVSLLNVRAITHLCMIITMKENVTVWLLSIVFLPGTLVHELAHFVVAEFLLVPARDLQLIPQIQLDRTVKLGGVQIAHTDRVRRFIIGVAPILIGLLLLWVGQYLVLGTMKYTVVAYFLYYFLLFQVSHTMFSSRKDLEGAVWGILGIGIVFFLIRILSEVISISYVNVIVYTINTYILSHIGILVQALWDALWLGVLLFVVLRVLVWSFSRVLHRH